MRRVVLGVVVVMVFGSGSATAFEAGSFSVFLGASQSLDSTLTIKQDGYSCMPIDAEWETRAFESPQYWALRFAFGPARDNVRWEIQLLHHKIHLANPTPEVERFEITHGFNILTFARSYTSLPITLRFGGGVVLAHPDSIVRGQQHTGSGGLGGSGYELAGPALLVGAGKDLQLSEHFFLGFEVQITAAWANVSVANGDASTRNVAIHGLVGLGYRF
ncbi:MAG: hypothetical protein GY906_12615 [bacterium]|nr:hypothetical protein [bacterium]